MQVYGVEQFQVLSKQPHFSAKMVFNAVGVILFSVRLEHRGQKAPGISYEDDYKGNALAAMLSPGKIEVRFHERFADERVAEILGELCAQPELEMLSGCAVTYQGRVLR